MMIDSRLATIAITLSLAASSALAVDCKNPSTTVDINTCAAIDQKAAEEKLNQVYQQVLKTFDGKEDAETRNKLIAAQRAWVTFRKADCDAVYQKWIGGTIRGVEFIGCMQGHAEQRTRELQQFGERP